MSEMHAALDSSNADKTLRPENVGQEICEWTSDSRPDPVDLLLHPNLLVFQRGWGLPLLLLYPGLLRRGLVDAL